MTTIPEVSAAMQQVLTEVAQQAGRPSGFVQRRSKLDGAGLVQTLVFGFLANPQATWEELAQTAAILGIAISPQGLDARLGPGAAECLRLSLVAATHRLLAAAPVALPLWQRFNGVYVQDSSSISLPVELAQQWQGCGGRQPGDGAAALKVQVQWELQAGQLRALQLQPGRASDRAGQPWLLALPPGALCLTDLGYFSLERLAAQAARGVYWLTRLQAGTRVEIAGQDRRLADWLGAQAAGEVDEAVRLGAQQRLPARLLARRVSAEQAAARRRRLHAAARDKGRSVSAERLALADWEVLVTNAPAEVLTLSEAWVVARARWQIELLFKLWKSQGQVAAWRSAKPWRILCELYAKLLGQLVQHWLILASCWSQPARSLVKAAQTIRKQAWHLASCWQEPARLGLVLTRIRDCLQRLGGVNKRRTAPAAHQLWAQLPARPALA